MLGRAGLERDSGQVLLAFVAWQYCLSMPSDARHRTGVRGMLSIAGITDGLAKAM